MSYVRRIAMLMMVVSCGRSPLRQPVEQHAFCGSTCWNNSYCTGQGIACEKCVAGTCSGSKDVAEAEASSR